MRVTLCLIVVLLVVLAQMSAPAWGAKKGQLLCFLWRDYVFCSLKIMPKHVLVRFDV